MVDEKTMTARHELLGRTYVIRELKIKHHIKWNAMQDRIKAMRGEEADTFKLLMEPPVAAEFLSAILLDENEVQVEFTEEMVGELTDAQLGAVLQDFFTLNPVLSNLLTTLLAAILPNSAETVTNEVGEAVNSGSTSSPEPATETSASAN